MWPKIPRDMPVGSPSRPTAALALLEEGIVNVEAINPTLRAGADNMTRVFHAHANAVPLWLGSSCRSVVIAIARHWMAGLRFR